MTSVERNSMGGLLSLLLIAVGCPVIHGENIASAFVSDETFNEESPPQILLSVNLGESVVDLNLNQSRDQVSDFPVFRINCDSSGNVSLRSVPIKKLRTMYQDQDKEAAFLRSFQTDSTGTNTVIWEGLVHSKGLIYQLTSTPSARASPSGRARGRSFNDQASTRVQIPFDVQSFHPSKFKDKFTDDFVVPDGRTIRPRTETQSGGFGGRQKRQTSNTENVPVYIDIVAFADYGVYTAWYERSRGTTEAEKHADAVEQMTQHYAFLFNGVDLLYKNIPRSYVNITVRLVSLLYAATPEDSSITETLRETVPGERHDWVNGYTAMDKVRIWVRNNSAVLPAHDHFMYFIGYDITNGTTNTLMGYAYIGTTCNTDGRQTSITEDIGNLPASLLIAAHELGHSLSAYHDGDGPKGGVANSCLDSDSFLMSSFINFTKLNSMIFSKCSVQYFSDFINQQTETDSGRECVNEMLPVNSTIPDVTGRMPGQIYNVHEQCRQIYGNSSYLCTGVTALVNNKSEVCQYLFCLENTTTMCRGGFAARGTTCGDQMWCIDGRCVYDRSAPHVMDDCVFGDQQGPVYTDSDDGCAEVVGRSHAKCYQTYVFIRCCSTCSALSRPVQGCEFGDRVTGCSAADCSNKSRHFDCCQTCNSGTPITTTTTTTPPPTTTTTTTTTTPPPTTTTTTTTPPPTTTTTTTTPPPTTTTTTTTTTPSPTTTTTPHPTTTSTTPVPITVTINLKNTSSDASPKQTSTMAPFQASQAACVFSTIVAISLAWKVCSSSFI